MSLLVSLRIMFLHRRIKWLTLPQYRQALLSLRWSMPIHPIRMGSWSSLFRRNPRRHLAASWPLKLWLNTFLISAMKRAVGCSPWQGLVRKKGYYVCYCPLQSSKAIWSSSSLFKIRSDKHSPVVSSTARNPMTCSLTWGSSSSDKTLITTDSCLVCTIAFLYLLYNGW